LTSPQSEERKGRTVFGIIHMADVSDQVFITADDGSYGRRGIVTDPLPADIVIEAIGQQPNLTLSRAPRLPNFDN